MYMNNLAEKISIVSYVFGMSFQEITNVLQAINFSINFLLYSLINVYVRQSMARLVKCQFQCSEREEILELVGAHTRVSLTGSQRPVVPKYRGSTDVLKTSASWKSSLKLMTVTSSSTGNIDSQHGRRVSVEIVQDDEEHHPATNV